MGISDDAFERYAAEQEAAARAAQSGGSGFSGGNYEKVEWTGLESNKMKLIRAVGGPPDSKVDNTTARTARITMIVGDDGKKFRCVLPERADDPDHILWRIIARVNAAEWVDKKKIFPVEQKHPEIFNIINHNGFTPDNKQFIFDRGWTGRQVLIMNVIDREQMDWHREHKHTMLLSRNIGVGQDGTRFPEEGVPSWGFSSLLANLFKYYKSWEKYDIGILRTGLKESPYRIINATKYFEEVPAALQGLVVSDPLSEEEASWERYDLSKLFKITYYTKIYNRLKLTIGRIDAALGTHYLKEMEAKVAEEKVEFDAINAAAKAAEEAGAPATESAPEAPAAQPAPATRAAPVRAAAPKQEGFDVSKLKGWSALSDADRAQVAGVVIKDDKVTEIQYKNLAEGSMLLACPDCTILAPDTMTVCPNCGMSFV